MQDFMKGCAFAAIAVALSAGTAAAGGCGKLQEGALLRCRLDRHHRDHGGHLGDPDGARLRAGGAGARRCRSPTRRCKNKDIDVFLGNWMPTHDRRREALPRRQVGRDDLARTSKAPATAWWCRPTSPTAGVKSLADIGKFKDKFDGKIYGIEPGNDGNRIVLGMIDDKANGLEGFELVESSEAGMLAQAREGDEATTSGSCSSAGRRIR